MDQTKINDTINILCEKYKNNAFMSGKTQSFICNQLPIILQNIEKTHEEQVQRITEMNAEQDIFIQGFLTSNHYFYASTTENFFYYDGINYHNVTEDEILHNVLSSISRDRTLMSWKYKTKTAIMKRIKDNAIFTCIPESATIQIVLNSLHPAIFATKTEAKYFLTVLGDNILKKQNDAEPLIYLINQSAKSFVDYLNGICQMWFGVNLNQSFKYRYHTDHPYSNTRILYSNANSANTDMIRSNGINLLCVACHYSNRYQNSDNYLIKYSNDAGLMEYAFFLKNATPESLASMFLNEYIVVSSSSASGSLKPVSWKNMLYLWKHFLESKKLPNAMGQTKLKNILTVMLEQNYLEDGDCFVNISSKYLPTINKFLQFWEETMVYDETEPEIEISEIATLFRQHTSNSISENQILNILIHFFPDLEIEIDQDKYIYRMRSTLWDKQVDIMMAMDDLRDKIGAESFATICVYDSYAHYCNYMNGRGKRRPSNGTLTTPMLVSKQYFEKYIAMSKK